MTSRINLVVPDQEAHWYARDGSPAYRVPNKSRPGEERHTTVRDARELDLYPSVSAFQQMLYKPALAAWINSQYILSALTLPREPHESHDAFAQRVVRDARVESQTAADFGVNIHDLADQFLRGEIRPVLSSDERQHLEGFMLWCYNHKVEPIDTEISFCRPDLGYGGRVDFLGYIDGVYVVADWKTQKTKPGSPVTFYREWNSQLSGYSRGVTPVGEEEPQKLSVVISSTEIGRVESFLWLRDSGPQAPWEAESIDWGWLSFIALRDLYYSPLGQGWTLRKRYGNEFTID